MNHILTGGQFTDKKVLKKILSQALEIEEILAKGKTLEKLKGKIVATLFYEPSTRTRLSFEAAAIRLGAGVISTENASVNSSAFKGETIEDTVKVVEGYADIIVMRHPESGSAEGAAKVSKVPIINAGDGSNEHPTQALLDLYTIQKEFGRLENLKISFAGDLLYGRTVHSLLPLLSAHPGNEFCFASPKELALPDKYKTMLAEKKIKFTESHKLEDVLGDADIVYMTRVQKERFKNIVEDYDRIKNLFVFKPEHLKKMKKKSLIMHPLPRVNEIDPRIDSDPRAAYFRQAQNGLYIRMALLLYSLELH